MGKNKRKGPLKKTQTELQNYKEFISSSSSSLDSTVPSQNTMLVGSDEVWSNNRDKELYGQEAVKKTPLKYRVLDWIKANLFAAVISAVIIGIATTVITHKVSIAIITQRIEYLDKKIDSIDEENVEKEYLQIQLELIKTEITYDNNSTLNELNWRLKDIEARLSGLESGSHND
ncbi:MAG: hypothetical protein J5528_01865 [Firmicutes bacterium]|nr:hypothetical protein [Bacillota bacterium]